MNPRESMRVIQADPESKALISKTIVFSHVTFSLNNYIRTVFNTETLWVCFLGTIATL